MQIQSKDRSFNSFKELIQNLIDEKNTSIEPFRADIANYLRKKEKYHFLEMFTTNRQQDAHELLAFLIDHLYSVEFSLNNSQNLENFWSQFRSININFMIQLFWIHSAEVYKCVVCGDTTYRNSVQECIKFYEDDLIDFGNIKDAITSFCSRSSMYPPEGSHEPKTECVNCGESDIEVLKKDGTTKFESKRTTRFKKEILVNLPQYLIIQINRIQRENYGLNIKRNFPVYRMF